jgi:hypothetical protein
MMVRPTKRVARSGIVLSRGSLLIGAIVAAPRRPRKRPNILSAEQALLTAAKYD